MYNIEPFIFIFRNGEYKVHGIRSIWVSIYNVDEMSFHPKMLRFPWVLIKADIWMIWADIWMSWVLIPVSQQPPSGWFELIAGWLELWSILGRFILLDNLHQLFSGISAWPAHNISLFHSLKIYQIYCHPYNVRYTSMPIVHPKFDRAKPKTTFGNLSFPNL